MSIIIRLQNLPLSAKSGDIRHFFGGLRIPEGGVHIIGGEKGDAFIAFTSDEDARIAMRKDGGKINDSRIKLFLSSHMEMQYEIERVTKRPFIGIQPQKSSSYERRSSPERRGRQRSPERMDKEKYLSRCSSPDQHRNVEKNKNRSGSPLNRQHRSRSRRRHSSYDRSRPYSHPGKRSPSPRRRSRSPHSKLSPLPKSRSRSPYTERFASFQKRKSISPATRILDNYVRSVHSSETDNDLKICIQNTRDGYQNMHEGWIPKEHVIPKHFNESQSSNRKDFQPPADDFSGTRNQDVSFFPEDGPQALLEKRITEVLTHNNFMGSEFHRESFMQVDNQIMANRTFQNMDAVEQHLENNNLTLNLQPSLALPEQYMLNTNNQYSVLSPGLNRCVNISGPNELHGNIPNTFEPSQGTERYLGLFMPPPPLPDMMNQDSRVHGIMPQNVVPVPNYYVTISGLHPKWNFRDVQAIMKGIYAPHSNIRWELDEQGYKTGTAFVKLCNSEDFKLILEKVAFVFNGRRITVSECPEFVFRSYFSANERLNENIDLTDNSDLCYMLKGLPFSSTYDDVINFFQDFELADIYIIYGENGKATGSGFVTFKTLRDYHSAMARNGEKIAHRYIELIPSTLIEMDQCREKYGTQNVPTSVTVSSSSFSALSSGLNTSSHRRPLCVLLTGLPPNITTSKVSTFFAESGLKPDAIHVTLNNKNQPNGRAFAEFSSFLDFDAALKCHRNYIGENIICVKQILYDEMSKILNSQKARHFKAAISNAKQKDFPEKVPYLWEPPDDCENKDKPVEMHDVNIWSNCKPDLFGNSRNESVPGTTLNKHSEQSFLEAKQHKPYETTGREYLVSESRSDNCHAVNPFDIYSRNVKAEDLSVFPVVQESKSQQPYGKSTKMDGTLDKTFKSECKKKVSKLSPDRESVKSDSANSDRKSATDKRKNLPNRIKDTKRTTNSKISPDRVSKTFVDRKMTEINNKPKILNKEKTGSFSRHSEKTYEYKGESQSKHGHRHESPFHTRSIEFMKESSTLNATHDEYNMDMKECTVQISNVHPDIGSDQLEDFFHDFDISKETFVRRYTDYGDPMGDVRVTFRSYYEAERAVKNLNRQYLKGIPVEMFIVN